MIYAWKKNFHSCARKRKGPFLTFASATLASVKHRAATSPAFCFKECGWGILSRLNCCRSPLLPLTVPPQRQKARNILSVVHATTEFFEKKNKSRGCCFWGCDAMLIANSIIGFQRQSPTSEIGFEVFFYRNRICVSCWEQFCRWKAIKSSITPFSKLEVSPSCLTAPRSLTHPALFLSIWIYSCH